MSTTAPGAPVSINALVTNLKAAGQDFEFYPTTPEIIACILKHRRSKATLDEYNMHKGTVLDIGAGNGAFLRAFGEKNPKATLLAIEKSPILMAELVKFAKVVGTDFHTQSFTSKNVDLVFCNPPYSEYELWTTRLIRECPAEDMYLVIPQRWKDNDKIAEAIKFREAKVKVIGNFDFLDADREARAYVDVLHIQSKIGGDKLFDKFFFERFPHLKEDPKDAEQRHKKEQKEDDTRRAGLVEREGLIGALVALYDLEMDRLQSNYDKASGMDAAVLSALGLSVDTIVTTLRARLESLKDSYWSELFGNLDSVTKRLTTKNRRAIMETIGGFKAVDFTKENIYAVLLWVMEHANQYIDSQILAVFDDMVDGANIVNYKSNQRVYGDGHWRYNNKPENLSHISLDYRIVIDSSCRGISRSYGSEGLSSGGSNFLMDLHTVATLLGFECTPDDPRLTEGGRYGGSAYWKPGKSQLFKTLNGEDLVEVRAFLNGNMHLRLSQKFSLALNIAVGKLRGWIRDHHQATSEFGKGAAEEFAKDVHVTPKLLFLSAPKPE